MFPEGSSPQFAVGALLALILVTLTIFFLRSERVPGKILSDLTEKPTVQSAQLYNAVLPKKGSGFVSMKESLYLEFAIFALIGVGFLVRRFHVVNQQGQKGVTNLVVDVILPCNIFKAFVSADLDTLRSDGIWVFGIALAFHLFCMLYGRLVFRKPPAEERNCLRFAALCSNAGFLGIPVAEGLYGPEGLALANVYLIPMRVFMWSTGIAIFSGSPDWRGTVKKVVTHPCIIAVEIGVAAMLLRLRLPEPLMQPVNFLSNCNTAMSMLVIGMILAQLDPKQFMDKTVLFFSLHRLILLPGIVYWVCMLLPISAVARNVSVMLCAMPVAVNTTILADKYNQNALYATKLVIVTTLFSIPTTALWSLILMQ